MESAIENKLFLFVCILLLVCVPFLNCASLPLDEQHQDEKNSSTKIEFLNPELPKTEQTVNHQIATETTNWGNLEHNDERSINLDGNTGSTTSQPFQTLQKSSVSKPTQGTTPIPPYIEIDDDKHTKISTEISNGYNTTTTAPSLENKLDKETSQSTEYHRDDENLTTTSRTSTGKNYDLTFKVNVPTISSPEPVVNNPRTKDDHVKIQVDQSSQRSEAPVQKETTANISSLITQGEKGNNASSQDATVNVNGLTNGNNENRYIFFRVLTNIFPEIYGLYCHWFTLSDLPHNHHCRMIVYLRM